MSTFQSKADEGRVHGQNHEHTLPHQDRKHSETFPTWTRRHPPPKVDECAGCEFL